jgi:hypothetical protein
MQDVRRIAFVSERFFELQGLGPALLGGALLFDAWLSHALGAAHRTFDSFQVGLFAMIVAGQAAPSLLKAYRRTFGDIVATRAQRVRASLPALLIYVGSMADMSAAMDHPRGGPSVAAVMMAAAAGWIVVRDWRWRAHYLAALAAGLTGAIVTAAVAPAPDRFGLDPARSEAFLLAYALMGLGLVFSGLLDHRLLWSSLQPARQDDAGPPEREPYVPKAAVWLGICAGAPPAISLALPDRSLVAALPMTLLLGLLATTIGFVSVQTFIAVRAFRHGRRLKDGGFRVDLDVEVLAALQFVALSIAIGIVLPPAMAMALPAMAIGLAGMSLAATRWPERRHELAWTLAALVFLAVSVRVTPPRAIVLFIVVMAAAWTARAAVTIVTASRYRSADAHTV